MMKFALFRKDSKTDFYQLLVDHAKTVYDAYITLIRSLEEENEEAAERVYFLEREADDLRRILIDRLNRTLITPFDREDIFALSRAVDEIIDAAQRTVEELHIFKVQPDDDLIAMAKVVEKGTLEIYDALKNMKDCGRGSSLRSPLSSLCSRTKCTCTKCTTTGAGTTSAF